MEKEVFDNNKIVEALCQFTFKSHQDNTVYGQFWDLLSQEKKFINKENLTTFNFTMKGNDATVTPSIVNAMKYSSADNQKVIQLHNNNISIHQIGNYQKWENFKDDIDYGLNNFNLVSKTTFERIDLRSINIFEFPLDGFVLSDYFNIFAKYPKGVKNPNENLTLEFPLEKDNNYVVIRLSSNIQEKINVVLDLSYICLNGNLSSDNKKEIDAILEYGSKELYKLFESSITEKTKQLIRKN